MEDKTTFLDPLLQKAEDYGKTTFELLKLKALDRTADTLSTLASRVFALLSILVFILLANIGLALWLGFLLGKAYFGFFCVAGFYALLGFVFYFLLHKWLKRNIGNTIVSKVLNATE